MPLSVFVYDDVWYNDKLKAYKYRRSNDQSDGDSVDNPSFECPGPDWVWAGRAKFNAPDHIIFETASKIDDRIQQRHSLTGWRMVQVVMAMNWVRIPSPETNTAIQEDGDNAKGVEKEENQDESEEEGVVEEEVKTIVQTLQRVWKILSFLRRPKRRWNEVEEEVFRRFMIAYRENESSPEENVQENTVQENTVQENTVQEETAQESSNVEEDAVTFAEVFHKLDLLMKPWNPAKFAFEVGLKTARRLIGRYLLVSRRTLENDQEEARDRRLEKQEKTIQGNYLHTSGTTRTTKLTSWWQAIRWNEPDIGNICSDAPKTLAPEGSVIKVVLGIANPEVGQEQSSNLQPVDSNLSTLREVENEHTVEICEMEAELDQSRPVEMVDEGSDTSSDNENERVTHPSETGVAEHDTITVTSGEHDESYGLQSIVGLSDNDSITFDGIAASEEPRLEVTIMKVTVIEVDDDSDCDTIGEDEHKVRDHSQSPSSLKSLRSPDRDQAVQENFEKDEIEKAAHKVFEKYKTLERHENEWKLHELPEFECQIRQTTTNFGLYWLGQGAVFPKLNDQSKHKEIASGDDKSYTESIPGDTDVEYWTLYTSPEDEDEWRARTSTPKSPEPQTCDKLTLIPELEEQDLDGWNFRVSQSLNNRDVVEPEVKDGGIPPNRTPENMAAKFREDFAAVMEEFDPDELEFESDQLYFETQPVERISESVDKPAVVNLEEKSSGVSSNRTQEQMATKFRDDFAAIMEEFDEDELDFEYQPPEGVHELERVSARAEARYADDGGTGNLLLLDFGIQNSAWDANIDPPPYSNEEDIEENSVPNPQWSEGLWDNWDEMEEARFHDELETREAGFILDQELYEHVIPQLGGNMTHFGGIKLYDGPADEEPLPAHESDELSEESDDSTETIKPSHFAGHDDSTDAPRSDSGNVQPTSCDYYLLTGS
ncbi:hypothetical protein M501DRAFT_865681 [Patellaria atrata CBS 101060]|uniref:Uncharacterized protein n=1 Tax=Patellaria atrata CBS 101060 TaxID=1346257 RepID=A0A9P4S942_9PEZI|nr:hypothetical protein M501DRAFT_865681 [Patellaria atrata CBS 101060]